MNQMTLFAILQQSEYDLTDFWKWYQQHLDQQLDIRPERWTLKLRMVAIITAGLGWLPIWWQFRISLWLLAPIEKVMRWAVYIITWIKLRGWQLAGGRVVALAGSYGKTSTKQIAEYLLSPQVKVLVTPASINTLLGIARVVWRQLHGRHQLFIVELGEYHPHDLPQLLNFTNPDLAILTPIGRQHLAKLGDMPKIADNFWYLVRRFRSRPHKLLISDRNQTWYESVGDWVYYGESDGADYRLQASSVSRRGTEATINLARVTSPHHQSLNHPPHPKSTDSPSVQSHHFNIFTPLLGSHQVVNMLPAFWLGQQLRLNLHQLAMGTAGLPAVERRHQPFMADHQILILDNSYNTNPDSVVDSLKLLTSLPASRRLILTAGFAELGQQATALHFVLGQQLAGAVDYLGLIETASTDDIIRGFVDQGGKRDHVMIGKNFEETLAKLQQHLTPNSILLFEGGYREIYG